MLRNIETIEALIDRVSTRMDCNPQSDDDGSYEAYEKDAVLLGRLYQKLEK